MLHPLHIIMLREVRDHEHFEIRGASRHCADPVQPDPIRFHELHRLDRISVSHQVTLSTQFTSLYFVMMSCKTQSIRRFVDVCTPPRTHE